MTYYLVRHAASSPSADTPRPDWPLSDEGRKQARELATSLLELGIDRILCSPYLRATETVASFAAAALKEPIIVDDLRECDSTPEYTDNHEEILAAFWRGEEGPGAECATDCQQRIVQCLSSLTIPQENTLVCSHGQAIALYLNHIDSNFGYKQWLAMKFPAVFRVNGDGWKEIPV